jgi:O-antigen ligase
VNQNLSRPAADGIERAVAVHVSVFIISVSWAFGGNADWVRTPISAWGTLGIILTLAISVGRRSQSHPVAGILAWAWPVLVLNAIVLASCLTPGFHMVTFRDERLFMPTRVAWWIPSATRSGVATRALWLFDGIYFSCLNIAVAVRHRSTIRLILAIAVGNALALSVFGIVQKLLGSTGIYFGSVASPQPQFFASFVYDNHWGAFAIMMIGACIGLALRYAYGARGEGFFKGPAFTGLVAAAVMAVSIPFSGSRACTLLLAIMLGIAIVHGIPKVSRALRHSGVSTAGLLLGIAAFAVLAIGGAWMVAGDVIEARAQITREQVAEMWTKRSIGSRTILYSDTIRMARERPLFGWGMGSYPVVFGVFNTQESKIDRLPVVYHDAHSDWLQSLAELGLAGTALIGAAVTLPALVLRRSRVSYMPYFLLAGCSLVAAYAWIEFPFGNVAVVLSWWICFFCAIQYVRLSGSQECSNPTT